MTEKNKIIKILNEEGYPEFMHENTYQKVVRFHEPVKTAFILWVEDKKLPELSVEGYTFDFLTSKMEMQPVGAFITLDWLIRDPEKAKNALRKGIK